MCASVDLALSVPQAHNSSNLRSPAVGSRYHPLWVYEGASAVVDAKEVEGGLILDGVGLHLDTPNDPLPTHT